MMNKNVRKTFRAAVLSCMIAATLCLLSCDTDCTPVDVSGYIHYSNGVNQYITFTVTGGSKHYKFYYAKSAVRDEEFARSIRTSIGSGDANTEYTVDVDGYRSTGWHYYIWAVDDYMASGYAHWHP